MFHTLASRILGAASALLLATAALHAAPPTKEDKAGVAVAVKGYLLKESPNVKPKVKTEAVEGDYARATVTSPDTDDGIVYLQRQKGGWKVLILGTGITPNDLRKLGVPKSLHY